MLARSTRSMKLAGLLGLALLLLAGCAGESGDGGGGQSDEQGSSRFSDENVQAVDDAIAQAMEDQNLPGVVVAVSVPGEGEYVAAEGEANLETGAVRELGEPFRIASITKAFAGTAILQLADQRLLSTADPLSKWYPDFPNAEEITVGDLLRMRSGIADSADQEFLEYYYDNPETDLTAEDMIELSANKADEFEPPDQETKYTNVNFIILAEIVEKVSGNDIGTQLSQGIFEPLGMESTIYPTNDELSGDLRGYSLDPESEELVDMTVLNPAPAGGAGAIISDVSDLGIFARALYTGSLLDPETQEARLQAQTLEGAPDFVGYGEGIEKLGNFWGHNGTIFGFSSEMYYLPEEDATIVVNVNRLDEDDESKSTDLFLAVTKILFPEYVDW